MIELENEIEKDIQPAEVEGTILVIGNYAYVLINSRFTHSFISPLYDGRLRLKP